MAFALTKAVGYGVEAEEAVNKRYKQVLLLTITAANTDVDLDLGDYAGTFWDAVDGTTVGATALAAIKQINVKALTLLSIGGDAILNKLRVATATNAGEWSAAMNSTNTHLPDIAFDSGDAPTSYVVALEWALKDGEEPVEFVAA